MTGLAFPSTTNDVTLASGASSTMTMAPPVNTANGDLLIAWIIDRSTVTGSPAGWTQDASWSTNGVFTVWHLPVPTASSLPSSWGWNVGSRNAGIIFRVTGTNLTTPVSSVGLSSAAGADSSGAAVYTASLPLQISGVTMTGGGVAFVGCFWEGAATPSDHVPGFTQIAAQPTGGGRGGLSVFATTTSGATGTVVCTNDWTSGSDGEDGILMSINTAGSAVKNPFMVSYI
jgi:hypothetical protein